MVLQGLFKLEHDVASVAPGTTLSYELPGLVSNPWNNPEVLDATWLPTVLNSIDAGFQS